MNSVSKPHFNRPPLFALVACLLTLSRPQPSMASELAGEGAVEGIREEVSASAGLSLIQSEETAQYSLSKNFVSAVQESGAFKEIVPGYLSRRTQGRPAVFFKAVYSQIAQARSARAERRHLAIQSLESVGHELRGVRVKPSNRAALLGLFARRYENQKVRAATEADVVRAPDSRRANSFGLLPSRGQYSSVSNRVRVPDAVRQVLAPAAVFALSVLVQNLMHGHGHLGVYLAMASGPFWPNPEQRKILDSARDIVSDAWASQVHAQLKAGLEKHGFQVGELEDWPPRASTQASSFPVGVIIVLCGLAALFILFLWLSAVDPGGAGGYL